MTDLKHKIPDAKNKSKLFKSLNNFENLQTDLVELVDATIDEELSDEQKQSIAQLRRFLVTTFKGFN